MFVGHALLAFAVAGLIADWRGWPRQHALFVAVIAGAFGALPDIDILYALTGLGHWLLADNAPSAPTAFWNASRTVHRSVTHSLLVGAVAAPAFGLAAFAMRTRESDRPRRPIGSALTALAALASLSLFGLLVLAALLRSGPLAAFVMSLFLGTGALLSLASVRASTLASALVDTPAPNSSLPAISPSTLTLAALWGLWSHPWGDLVTGSPPDWFFPADSTLLTSRVVLHSDPTLHLLAAFAIELGAIWLAAITFCRLTDRSAFAAIDPRAGLAAGYGLAAVVTTPPTLDVSYHFVFSILSVGLLSGITLGSPISVARHPRLQPALPSLPRTESLLATALTGLTAITSALLAYLVVYLSLLGSV
ncbi:metal-dependent hydrolase [Natrialba asiatica]|uniref:Membrane-bound metal-dependent hydrolase n=1 Tax=Natrialba asiatica (strain ATCC 700177 / DSM 12278 / JCM 9576 / FERM P-10747 / NBRC 102637 / 172P1) TaxID=29540 RepID=M0AVD7_NATA1|nr:metal-dependent hydrolase [Natrialba asiatica]ELZ01359.1 membrane-bound metal-dependent hydrolase [Natrialba asiatica DSM 12278]